MESVEDKMDLYFLLTELANDNKEMLFDDGNANVSYRQITDGCYVIDLRDSGLMSEIFTAYVVDEHMSNVIVTYYGKYIVRSKGVKLLDVNEKVFGRVEFCYDGFSLEEIRFSLLKINVDLFAEVFDKCVGDF